jgi:uncharacterized repeat protein (TIGR01451 family)
LSLESPPHRLDVEKLVKWSQFEPAYHRLDVEKNTRLVRFIPLPHDLFAPAMLDKSIQQTAGPLHGAPKPATAPPKVEPVAVVLKEPPSGYRIGKQLLLVARVVGQNQQPLSDQAVEWTIDHNGVGEIVAFASDARIGKPGEKFLPTFARTYTAVTPQTLDPSLGGAKIEIGETWCVVEAHSAGAMLVSARIPSLATSAKGAATARLHWDHAEIQFPPRIEVQAGTEAFPIARVTTAAGGAGEPLPNYKVRCTLTEPNGAAFPGAGRAYEGETASDGSAVLPLRQEVPKVGETRANVELLGPNPLYGQPAVVLAKGTMVVSWAAPEVHLIPSGPAVAAVGEWVKLTVKGTVGNVGLAKGLRLSATAPADLVVASGNRLPSIDLGDWPPADGRPLEMQVRSDQSGSKTVRFEVRSGGHTWSSADQTIRFAAAEPALAIKAGDRWEVGVPSVLAITVKNPSEFAASGLRLRQAVPPGFRVHSAGQANIEPAALVWEIPRIDPGAEQSFECSLIPNESGKATLRAHLSGGGSPSVQAATEVATAGVVALKISLQDSADPVEVGGRVEYEVVLENQGTAPAENIVLSASMPPQMQLESASGSLLSVVKDGKLSLGPVGSLAPGGRLRCKVKVKAASVGEARFVVRLEHPSVGPNGVEEQESTVIYKP